MINEEILHKVQYSTKEDFEDYLREKDDVFLRNLFQDVLALKREHESTLSYAVTIKKGFQTNNITFVPGRLKT